MCRSRHGGRQILAGEAFGDRKVTSLSSPPATHTAGALTRNATVERREMRDRRPTAPQHSQTLVLRLDFTQIYEVFRQFVILSEKTSHN